jgi:ubiquinone/menaquinone biosynthesis C-methylase UbiE
VDHFQNIYTHHADIYHRMIAAEDVDSSLLPALERVTPLAGKCILDLGSGTGRLPLLLHHQAAQVVGLDYTLGMLREQQVQRQRVGGEWDLLQGDLRQLPFTAEWADLVTAGWAIGHFQSWYEADWQSQVDRAIEEMLRVLVPGGALVIIETLTTGSLTPSPPSKGLARYYAWLETHWGFTRQEIATDYQFADLAEAIEMAGFFFGASLAEKVRANHWVRLPEWTGVWGKIKAEG